MDFLLKSKLSTSRGSRGQLLPAGQPGRGSRKVPCSQPHLLIGQNRSQSCRLFSGTEMREHMCEPHGDRFAGQKAMPGPGGDGAGCVWGHGTWDAHPQVRWAGREARSQTSRSLFNAPMNGNGAKLPVGTAGGAAPPAINLPLPLYHSERQTQRLSLAPLIDPSTPQGAGLWHPTAGCTCRGCRTWDKRSPSPSPSLPPPEHQSCTTARCHRGEIPVPVM